MAELIKEKYWGIAWRLGSLFVMGVIIIVMMKNHMSASDIHSTYEQQAEKFIPRPELVLEFRNLNDKLSKHETTQEKQFKDSEARQKERYQDLKELIKEKL